MKDDAALPIDALIHEVQESAKYRHVSPDLIRRIGTRELSVRRNLKEAVKETKNTLHQIAGAFLDSKMRYDAWLQQLQQAAAQSATENKDTSLNNAGTSLNNADTIDNADTTCCVPTEVIPPSSRASTRREEHIPHPFLRPPLRDIMTNHASTRERLPLLDTFYAQTLAKVAPVRSVLDLCCGLHPLALPWMPLAPDAAYYACDLYGDMMAFLNSFFALAGIAGNAEVCDVAASPPACPVHLALLLKALPPLEQSNKRAALRLLQTVNAEHILVSFPTRTLAGHNKNMGGNYETRFRTLIAHEVENCGWQLERFAFPNELCFLVSKPG